MAQEILIATIRKVFCKPSNSDCNYYSQLVSFDRDKLKSAIENKYNLELIKNECDDFPYFTDGGFKYSAENVNWKYEIEAHPYKVIT